MPVSFTRLRIAGFKSFPEPAVVEIRPGLTGIVGPNGCGKSNVVEALRWAMGENSARSLRGGEMDDVIFAGTAHRASRNIAEVTLTLEDAAGRAPPPFHETQDLEISRRIERGRGSDYRVNGREARARDVQTLFADLASGARASAMVSQGRVSALVGARPEERRSVMEEAAGITGLHARRHEAELRLRATEANLERAEDLRGQLETQLETLKRQARQAHRYRTISDTIRAAEAELLALQRARAEAGRESARAALQAARAKVVAATTTLATSSAAAAEAAAALPPLRSGEGDARTALERHRIAGEQVAAEERRAQEALAAVEQRLAQLVRDLAHARQLREDAATSVTRLADETSRLAAEEAAHPPMAERAETEAQAAAEAAREAEAAAQAATEHAAEIAARHRALADALAQAEQRERKLRSDAGRLAEEHGRIAAQLVAPARLDAANSELEGADRVLASARAATEAAERARVETQAELAAARDRATAAHAAHAKLAAEVQALAEVLAVKDGERWPRMVDQLTVAAGLEAALGAALGEELESGCDASASRHWRDLPALADVAWPDGVTPVADLVAGPSALARAIGAIGLVETPPDDAVLAGLAPGRMLVSRAGGVWRWDGYTIAAGTPTAAAVRLQQRNRLAGLRARLAEAVDAARTTSDLRAKAEQAERAATAAERDARAARGEAERRLERARSAAAMLATQDAQSQARLAALDQQKDRLATELAAAQAALAECSAARSILASPDEARAAMERTRAAFAAARARETRATSERDTLVRTAAARAARQRTIKAEARGWAERAAGAESRVADLAAREQDAAAERGARAAEPARIAAARVEAIETVEAAQATHRRVAETLLAAERHATEADRHARAGDAALATAREQAVQAEGAAAQAHHAWGVVAERILERLGPRPALPDSPAERGPEAEEKARRRLERLQREREEMGPVNLRAELESEALTEQIATILRERDEIATAIAKLRGSIGHLNREGRERLGAAFTEIDRHFQSLYARMFGGGRAHLALVGSDDPLEAGLEIYAQPPGKKLATLSLLSGGEQALTALSLIFAAFRCNPAPVCVLDEVDAPLDDANVERFCTLLDDMVRETGTRFMVVTHHHLTMARMDRLYGVTMQERGVSRLLSVDLAGAEQIVDRPRMAAE